MSETISACVYCQRTSNQVPLLQLEFNGRKSWICPQHLPILIHKPEMLLEKFPGMQVVELPDHLHD